MVVGLAIVDSAGDLRVHLRATQLFRRILCSNRGLHQRRSGQK
jgi:hypothetical protein